MKLKQHRNARTTPALRQEIRTSLLSVNELAKKYHLSWATVKKWKLAKNTNDHSSRPKRLRTNLSQEDIDKILFERKQFKKTIEDIFFTLENEIENIYPMKIYRVLARYEMGKLPAELVEAERKIKKFRKYGIGFIHIDMIHSPKIDGQKSYIYTAIDRVCKVIYVKIVKTKRKEEAVSFLKGVLAFLPYKVNYILTDNGHEFTHKGLPKHIRPKAPHPFGELCKLHKIQHRTTKFRHPWTNGMVERLNRTIRNKVIKKYVFQTIFDMNGKLIEFANRYNHTKRLKSLSYKTPADYLQINKGRLLQRIVI